ncbi:DUF2336 domain-containing protein [Roseibium sp.]|uniref:DUF2336 domain-containing protein n=1 Tax=Roseibium sp. TaxID=1936156 RepID=UPI003A9822DD
MLSLNKLSELARDRSKGSRKSLVTALTDLFVSSETEQAEQVSIMFGEIVMRVLGQLEEETRMALAKRVGGHPAAPHELITTLAKDEIAIAEPVLRESPVLTSEDLESIARDGSMQHLEVIAGRNELAENVTNVLVDRGNLETLNRVADNQGARMADQTFCRLVEKARSCPDIQALLVDRKDLPKEAAEYLAEFLSDELKERVSNLGGDSVLAGVMAERAAEEVKARASRLQANREETVRIIDDVVAGRQKLDAVVAKFAKADRAAELGILLAKVSDLPAGAVSPLIYSQSDKPLVILCKANGVSEESFKHILTMRARRMQTGFAALDNAMKRYAALPVEGAKRSLEALVKSARGDSAEDEAAEPEERGAFMRSKNRGGAPKS